MPKVVLNSCFVFCYNSSLPLGKSFSDSIISLTVLFLGLEIAHVKQKYDRYPRNGSNCTLNITIALGHKEE